MVAAHDRKIVQLVPWERRGLTSGLLFGGLQLTALAFSMLVVVPTHAPIDAPPVETARALAAHPTLIAVGTYLFTLPLPFFLLFLGGLFGTLRRAEGGNGALSVAILAAGIVASSIAPFGAVISSIGSGMAQLGGDPVVVKQIDAMTPLAMALTGLPHAVFVGATALLVGHERLTRPWIMWLGLVVAVLGMGASGTLIVASLFPLVVLEMVLFPIWILALTIALLKHQDAMVQKRPSTVSA